MPIQLRANEARGFVEVILSGVVTDPEFAESMDRYLAESFAVYPLALCDASAVTDMDISAATLRNLARRASRRVDSNLGRGKLAVVAPSDMLFGMARMYGILREDSPVEVRAFRERDEAESWLGL